MLTNGMFTRAKQPLPRIASAMAPLFRFGVVTVVGLGVGLALAWWLATPLRIPLTLAAGSGFAAGAAFNYLLARFFVFPARGGRS